MFATMYDGEGFVAAYAAGHDVPAAACFSRGRAARPRRSRSRSRKFGAAALTIHQSHGGKGDGAGGPSTANLAAVRGLASAGERCPGSRLGDQRHVARHARGRSAALDARTLDRGALVARIVISDAATPFLAAARERDCTLHPGKPMLEAQIDLMIEFMGLTAK
jgi:shikimate dehydrogenase